MWYHFFPSLRERRFGLKFETNHQVGYWSFFCGARAGAVLVGYGVQRSSQKALNEG